MFGNRIKSKIPAHCGPGEAVDLLVRQRSGSSVPAPGRSSFSNPEAEIERACVISSLGEVAVDQHRQFTYFVRVANKGACDQGQPGNRWRKPVMMPFEVRSAIIYSFLLFSLTVGQSSAVADQDRVGMAAMTVREFKPVIEERWQGFAVCYGPYRDGQRPGGPTPTAAQIREDLLLMSRHWGLLRLYGSSEFARDILEEIRAADLDMKVMLGVWIEAEDERDGHGNIISRDPAVAAANRREADAAIALASAYPDLVLAVCVGNETQVSWSPHPTPLELLIDFIRDVRAAVSVPVTTADDYQYWVDPQSRTLAVEIDFITMHAHPLWNGRQLEQALPWLGEQVASVQSAHPGRLLVVGETGWATGKADEGEQAELMRGRAGESEQSTYYHSVREWSHEEGVPTFVFEAFDENWKGSEDPDDAEKHWGLFRADRSPKAALLSGGPACDQ